LVSYNCDENAQKKIASILCLVFTMGVVQAQDANILVSLNSPGYGVKIKNNFPHYNGGYARAFMLSNQDASADLMDWELGGM